MIEKRYKYFSMAETPQQRQTLPSFWISKYPVTNQQYFDFLNAMPGHPPPSHWEGKSFFDELANHPITHVSWYDAVTYARWRGGRLPSEFEWEKAARGNHKWDYPWGNKFDSEKCNAQLDLDGFKTTPVGIFPEGASVFGVLDMAGNVWEWTASSFLAYPGHTGSEVNFDDSYYVTRGGSYWNPDIASRCSCRFQQDPRANYENLGFRIVMSSENERDNNIS